MAQYRKKPVVVDAEMFDAAFRAKWYGTRHFTGLNFEDNKLHIETLEGTMTAEPGDWIITGVKGEKYPCKPDIFAITYEAV